MWFFGKKSREVTPRGIPEYKPRVYPMRVFRLEFMDDTVRNYEAQVMVTGHGFINFWIRVEDRDTIIAMVPIVQVREAREVWKEESNGEI